MQIEPEAFTVLINPGNFYFTDKIPSWEPEEHQGASDTC